MCKEIILSQGRVALVSDCDYTRVAAHKWSLDKNGYAVRKIRVVTPDGRRIQRKILLHRFILNAPRGRDVDHVNRDRLDCRRENLRPATRSQNMANVPPRPGGHSRYKGVTWRDERKAWRAEIRVNGERRRLGSFATEIEAARAYDRAAHAAWGEYAFLNFPHEFRSESSSVAA